jgi:hypothetical protein
VVLLLGVLVGACLVAHAAAQPGDPEASGLDDLPVGVGGAAGARALVVLFVEEVQPEHLPPRVHDRGVVVAGHEHDGDVDAGGHVLDVLPAQVARREHEVRGQVAQRLDRQVRFLVRDHQCSNHQPSVTRCCGPEVVEQRAKRAVRRDQTPYAAGQAQSPVVEQRAKRTDRRDHAVRRKAGATTGGRAASEASGQTRPRRTAQGRRNHRWSSSERRERTDETRFRTADGSLNPRWSSSERSERSDETKGRTPGANRSVAVGVPAHPPGAPTAQHR